MAMLMMLLPDQTVQSTHEDQLHEGSVAEGVVDQESSYKL